MYILLLNYLTLVLDAEQMVEHHKMIKRVDFDYVPKVRKEEEVEKKKKTKGSEKKSSKSGSLSKSYDNI